MINLLPNDIKDTLFYARRNTHLRSWAMALLIAAGSLIAIGGAGYLYLKQATVSYEKRVDLGKASLVSQKQSEVKAEVEDLTNSLKLVDQVLSKEVLFSKLLEHIGATMPAGSVLTNLNINDLEGGLDLQAAAVNYQTGTQVHINLSDPENKTFQQADLVSIQCQEAVGNENVIDSLYPCKVVIRALFAQENPFLFINSDDGNNDE